MKEDLAPPRSGPSKHNWRKFMTDREFIYVIYTQADAEKVWEGLTQPEFTRQYWFHDNVSDWKRGSRWEHTRSDGSGTVDIVGKVVESDRPERLVLTWSEPKYEGNSEKTALLTLKITPEDWPHGSWVRLRVVHAELDDEMYESVSFGWPGVCSGLKTLLERGTFEKS
jgi:uncharacterized protein YndB with AHSA1/START domain